MYRDAVTKLRILLEASEAAAEIAAQDTTDGQTSKVRQVKIKAFLIMYNYKHERFNIQVNFDGSVDRNVDKRYRSRLNVPLHFDDPAFKQKRSMVLGELSFNFLTT